MTLKITFADIARAVGPGMNLCTLRPHWFSVLISLFRIGCFDFLKDSTMCSGWLCTIDDFGNMRRKLETVSNLCSKGGQGFNQIAAPVTI